MAYGYFKRAGKHWKLASSEVYEKRAIAVAVFQDKLIWEGGEIRRVAQAGALPTLPPPQCQPCQKHLHGSCLHGSCDCGCKLFWPAEEKLG